MTATTIYFLIIFLLIADFLLERSLSFLNIKNSRMPLPDILADIYDAEKYLRQQDYFRANVRFSMLTSSFSFIVTFSVFVFGGFGWLDTMLSAHIANEIFRTLVFFGILYLANDILSLPFEIYDIFVIEQRFDFNRITPRIFILDKLKGYLITTILGAGLIALIMWIYSLSAAYFWFIAWSAVTAFSLFMALFYSDIIVPLFNKQKPLAAGELRDAIEEFAKKAKFKLKNIYIIDGSKRSTKANAYFTGFGPKKRIVLYDTLLDKLTTKEIVAVLAHEIGHNKHRDTLKTMAISLLTTLLLFYFLGLILSSDILAQAMGGERAAFGLNVLAFGILYSPVSMILNLWENHFSRRHEYHADAFAASYGLGNELVAGLKKLSATSLSNLTPHPAYVFFHYSHPTLYQRVTNVVALNS
ncbi:MAG: M48 family metallopeptidase [Paludibacter sp.]|jgi:STE24 endopeptidase|nr:M48 family metallopeptidase [Paludibacter sp.]